GLSLTPLSQCKRGHQGPHPTALTSNSGSRKVQREAAKEHQSLPAVSPLGSGRRSGLPCSAAFCGVEWQSLGVSIAGVEPLLDRPKEEESVGRHNCPDNRQPTWKRVWDRVIPGRARLICSPKLIVALRHG